MAARIIHFGGDGCNRLAVLELAGYEVQSCNSVSDLLSALSDDHQPDAVVITELGGDPEESTVELARERSEAPLILFQSADCRCSEAEFDLVIPTLTPPRFWLERIAAAIERSRAIHAERRALGESSAELRRQSAAVRERCARERASLRATCDQKPATES